MSEKRYIYTSKFRDKHGKVRWRFRRKGFETYYFRSPHGTKEFDAEYARYLTADTVSIGSARLIRGSVSDVILRYYEDNAFLDLAPATQNVYRGVLERFRSDFGDDAMRRFDARRIAALMNAMRSKPHAATRLRKLLTQLMSIARREKLVPYDFDPIKDAKAPKPPKNDGYHRWTEEELSTFEKAYALGTKPRLAFSLLLFGAQRSGDVRQMTHDTILGGRIRLDQSKTENEVDLPIVAPLQEALRAGPLGQKYLLETKTGEVFTPKGFYGMIKKACVKAGIPHCSPHGLRKSAARRCREAGCTDEEGMAITGHKTVKEYRRYAGNAALGRHADVGMSKVYG